MIEQIEAKTILQKAAYAENWFGIDYNMNLYKGCPHGCIYCDSRSDCYQIEDFDRVRVKKDAITILEKELRTKRKKGVIGIGAMSDTYNPLEEKLQITRKALQLIDRYGYGISLETKSDLLVRDIDLFKSISNKASGIIKMTITTADDKLSSIIEPNVCNSSKRFEAIKKITDAGLFAGVLLTPILPYITDTEENIRQVISLAAKNGAKFVFSMGGVTLRSNQRVYFYNKLEQDFPGIKERYSKQYGNSYMCKTTNFNIANIFKEECKKHGLLYKMQDIIKEYKKENKEAMEQLKIF